MSMHFFPALLTAAAIGLFGTVAGCKQAERDQVTRDGGGPPATDTMEDYDPHDKPLTSEQQAELRRQTAEFSDAVAKIKELRHETEAETKDGIPENPYKAHQALDKADLLLQWLPGIARDSGVAKEDWEVVNTAANELRTLFERVHQNIDNREDPNFVGVATEIDRKIEQLEQIR